MAKAVKARDYPMVLNFVLHRHNIDQIDKIIELCIELDADDVELATCQFYGWAFLNRQGFCRRGNRLPTRNAWLPNIGKNGRQRQSDQPAVRHSRLLRGAAQRLHGRLGSIFLSVTPEGTALPCHSARQLPVEFPRCLSRARNPSGMTLSASTAIADLTGCRSRAAPAMKKRKTSAAAAASLYAHRECG